ncbi:MAG: ankyrin repeat domain-containing protein [Candidatus Gastranaerophilales bacterium]|nr:ankyrin repeat domain-containing protein [Candidatus Gastranaerophilales bacterium]
MPYFLIVLLFFTLSIPSFAFDVSELGDFSSRSIIEGKIYNRQSAITQEQRDLLTYKKLVPNSKCLFEQIKKGNYENVKILLQAKVNPNQSYLSEYPIYIAAKENKFDILKLLYENNAKLDRGFYSELYEALRNKNAEMAQYLLDRGAKVNYMDSITNNTILYMALKNKMYDLASQIILKGAKADTRSVKYIKKHNLGYLIPQGQ